MISSFVLYSQPVTEIVRMVYVDPCEFRMCTPFKSYVPVKIPRLTIG